MVQFLPQTQIAFPQNAMFNFQPLNQALQFYAQNQLDRGRFGLQQNQDMREQEMHPLRMDRERATTAGLWGQEGRAQRREPYDLRYVTAQTNQANAGAGLSSTQAAIARDANRRTNELHPYQLIQQYNAAIRPADQNDLIYGILGMQPPQPATPSPQPPWPAGVGPRPAAPAPAAAPQAGGPSAQGGVSFDPNSPTWQPQGQAQPQAPAPAAQPPQQTGSMWGGNPQAAAVAAGLATGRLNRDAATMILRGPAWAGQPDSVVNQAHTQAIAAATAAQTHQATISNVDRLVQIAPQAYVGANAQTRGAVANVLQSLGVPSGWLIQNQSLPATQLLAQGLAQFIGTEAEKYKPISNSDITFIQSTLANPNMTREALMQALAVSRVVAQRHAAYEAGRAELFLSTPQAPALLPQLAASIIQRYPSPVAGGGAGQPQAVGGPQQAQAPAAGQPPTTQAEPAASQAGGTDRWRGLTAQGQAQIIAALRNDPSLRGEIASRYGRDVLREILRAIGTPAGGPQTMSGF